MIIKEEKGSTLLLKLFAILFGIFIVFGYVFVHTVDSTGKILFQRTEGVCNINDMGYCFSMEILYMVALLVIAALGFLTITMITMEWGIRRESHLLSSRRDSATALPDFYRNCVSFLNCIKIALAVLFCTMFFKYSGATMIIPMAVITSLFMDSFVWNKRCREMDPKHESLLLDVVLEFMSLFSFRKKRVQTPVLHRQSFLFYIFATLFIAFCIASIATKFNKPSVQPVQQEQVVQPAVDSVSTSEELLKKQASLARAKFYKKRKYRKKVEAAPVEPSPSSTDDEDDDW